LPEFSGNFSSLIMTTSITFQQNHSLEFKKTLNKRVNEYFSSKGLSKHYNRAMILKTVIMLSLYISPFVLILSGLFPIWTVFLLYIIMGIGVSGVGMSVMHDGNHAGYSKNQKVNRLMGLTMNMVGADAYNWKIKHNKLHHVFTNIYGKDEDIESRVILRFAYAAPLKKYHRYQYLYAWFFYSLMTISMVFGDIFKRIRYRKQGITNISKSKFRESMLWLIFSKKIYFIAMLGLPLLLTNYPWWVVVAGFFIMHLTAGTILSLVFQMAHVVEGPEQPAPDNNGNIDTSLIVHQLRSTSNFSRSNKILSWFVGGLNFQIEHHLFPRICHVHYPAISKIVEETTREFELPYHEYDGFWDALRSHINTLKKLGKLKTIPV
jgi:linoleoyl-CoA desaturase